MSRTFSFTRAYLRWLLHPEQFGHLFLASILLAFADRLWQPNYMYTPAFQAMANLGSARHWSYCFLAIGIIGLSGLLLANYWWRNFGITLMSLAHVAIAVMFYQSIPLGQNLSTACTTYAAIATFGFHSLWWRIDAQ